MNSFTQQKSKQFQTRIQFFGFISLLFPACIRYYYVTMQKTLSVYSRWNSIPHFVILFCEHFALWTIHQAMLKVAPKIFWTRTFVSTFMGLLHICHFFIAQFDLIFNYGLLMRFGADVPMAYYLVKPPTIFDDSLPLEGQKFKESMGKAFIMHCWEAQKNEGKIVFSWIFFCLGLILLRTIRISIKSYCIKPKKVTQKKAISTKTKLMITIPTIAFFLFYVFAFNADKFDDFVPSHWYFYRTSIKHKMPFSQYIESVNELRKNFVLPEDEDWLDQREVPVFPLVHAPKEFVRAYNNQTSTVIEEKVNVELPNVVFLLWESFTPAPKYLNDEILLNKEKIFHNQPYRKSFLPKLAELAEEGHTFLGVRSNGIPTINGWHSLVTGEISSHHGVNMITSYYNEMDDMPSKLKQLGYYNLLLWGCGFQSDKNQNYVFRGKPYMEGPEFVKDFPLWFDEIHNFYPTKEEADMMGIEQYPKYQNYWTNDRLSSQMFNYYYNQRLQNTTQPIFGFWGNVDTHEDFSGFDDDQQYEQFNVGVGRSNKYDIYGRHDAFSTVLRYSDAAFGRIFDNIKKNSDNTIVIVLGDHASRQVPLYIHPDKRINVESPIYYDMDCNDRSVGADQQFITSAVMTYFGSNPIIKKRFDAIKNKTTFEPADHQDVVETLFNILSEAGAQKYPSGRLGQDLQKEATNLVEKKPTIRNPKISTSHVSMEYSDQDGYYRFNLLSPVDGYEIVESLPSCIAGKNSINSNYDYKKQAQAKRLIQLTSFLNENNRVYSQKFRDIECVKKGNCQFPDTVNPRIQYNIIQKLMANLIKYSAKLSVVLFVFVSILQGFAFIGRILHNLIFKKEQSIKRVFNVRNMMYETFITKSSYDDSIL